MSIRLGNNIVAGRSAYQPSLFDFKWADHALNDPSWVRADTYNWLYEAAYDVAYDHLVSDITGKTIQSETIAGITITFYLATDGHKICMPNQNDILQTLYDSTGIAWYYILDINNHRFKLPRTKWGFTGLRSQTSVGSYIAPGLPNITGNFRAANEYDYNNADISNKINGVFQVQDFPAKTGSSINQNSTPTGDGVWDITFNASRSSSVYGNSTTVQSPTTQMYLYFYLGSFSEQALENAADLSINELEEFLDDRVATKQDIATAVNYDNITNCITEIPQDIKLELNASVLTLKAGSKVYVPNGVGVFNEITISSDISIDYSGWGTQKRLLTYNTNNNSLEAYELDTQTASGDSAPTVPYVYMTWYDTTNNLVKYTNNSGSTWVSGGSLPLAIFSGADSVLYQVFNGFGYIGSTIFALPGVKGLIPNGRNSDGTLKSISFTSTNVITSPINDYTLGSIDYVFTGADLIPYDTAHYWYKEEENKNFQNYANAYVYATPICHCSLTSGVVSNFIPKTIYHPVDYSEADFVIAFQRPTSSNDYTWYRLYKSGWIEQGGRLPTQGTTTTVTLPHAMADTNYSVLTQEAEDGSTDTDGVDFCCLVCVRTTTTIKFSTVSGARRSFYEVKGFAA